MSDGPWKTLWMSRSWRRVARFTEVEASSSEDIAQNLRQALVNDFRKISTKVIPALRKVFGDGRQRLLGLNEHEKLVALRPCADGNPLGALLLSHAVAVSNEGYQGDVALREAVIRTLQERVTHGGRQVEEHHYRESADGRATGIRKLIDSAATRVDWVALANQLMGNNSPPVRRSIQRLTGIDDGPRL